MEKLKINNNKHVLSFEFHTDLLAFDRLYNICRLFEFEDIYMDIYSICNREKDLYNNLSDNKLTSQVFCARRKHFEDIHIKLSLNCLPQLLQILADYEFEEINVWDCYDSWENYIEDKKNIAPFITLKSDKVISNNKFYLNYVPDEGGKVTIICDLSYKNEDLQNQLAKYIK